jgi:hypothetical protein
MLLILLSFKMDFRMFTFFTYLLLQQIGLFIIHTILTI